MCDDRAQELDDLREFLNMLDFGIINGKVVIIENQFDMKELPATVQNHVYSYLKFIKTIS